MANEAVVVELGLRPALSFTVANGTGISKGAILKITDPRTAAASSAAGDAFAGIASADKEASDGTVKLGVWTQGIFDLQCNGAGFVAGELVIISGANLIRPIRSPADISAGAVIGKALETAVAGTAETVLVAVGYY